MSATAGLEGTEHMGQAEPSCEAEAGIDACPKRGRQVHSKKVAWQCVTELWQGREKRCLILD